MLGVDGEQAYYAYKHEPFGGFQRDKLEGGGTPRPVVRGKRLRS